MSKSFETQLEAILLALVTSADASEKTMIRAQRAKKMILGLVDDEVDLCVGIALRLQKHFERVDAAAPR